jgi:hypothetical protein
MQCLDKQVHACNAKAGSLTRMAALVMLQHRREAAVLHSMLWRLRRRHGRPRGTAQPGLALIRRHSMQGCAGSAERPFWGRSGRRAACCKVAGNALASRCGARHCLRRLPCMRHTIPCSVAITPRPAIIQR